MTKYLVTGAAGFIGFHLADRLLGQGHEVVGVDNLNDYYSVQLKQDRLAQLRDQPKFHFKKLDLADRALAERLFSEQPFDRVLHMAAQAGVRYSLTNPHAYIESNLVAFANVLEGCRASKVPHLVYASSSSVYGANRKVPFSTDDRVDHPVSLYAATKKSNELMAYSYSHLYRLPTTGLRFFTVYGPWGRPDMALYRFTKAISRGEPIDVYNHGQMRRDFTYIDDIVTGVLSVAEHLPKVQEVAATGGPESELPAAPHRLYNIGNNQPEELEKLIAVIEECLGIAAVKNYLPLQPGDVLETYADIDDLEAAVGFRPITDLKTGVAEFVKWYRNYAG